MSIKISSLEVENVKRVRAVSLTPTSEGLTILGGKNGQGKTSVLDSIAWCLGGNKFMPSSPQRDGSTIPPHLKIKLSNGIVVERSGKNSSLKVIDPEGNKSGQTLLNEFISQFALDLPKFMQATGKEKADILLQDKINKILNITPTEDKKTQQKEKKIIATGKIEHSVPKILDGAVQQSLFNNEKN